jgi:hypothetical protein
MAEVVYNRGKQRIMTAQFDLDGTSLRACYISGTKTGASDPDLDTVADLDAVTSVVVSGDRATPGTQAVAQNDTNDRGEADCANFSFPAAAGVTALALVLYDEGGGTDATRHLLAFYDTGFGAGLPVDGGLNVTIGANGYLWGT